MIHITGATGHIGNNLVRLLIEKKIPFQLLERQSGPALNGLPVKEVTGDIFDPHFLNAHVSPKDTIIHIAALIDLKNKQSQESDKINYIGTKTIIDFCIKQQVRLIYTSSVDCINRDKQQAIIKEPDTINPELLTSNYAASKGKATRYLLDQMQAKALDAVVLYPSAVIGVHDYKPSAAGIEIMHSLKRRVYFYIKGGYNFIDVRDIAKAIETCIEKRITGSYILAGHNRTLLDFYHQIAKTLGRRAFYCPIPASIAKAFVHFIPRFSRMMVDAVLDNYHYDNSLMCRDLLDTVTPFEQTVADTIEWFQSQPKR